MKKKVESTLGFTSSMSITEDDGTGDLDTRRPGYPGGDVYALVMELANHMRWYQNVRERLDSWANDRLVREKRASLFHIEGVQVSLRQLVNSLRRFKGKTFSVLRGYFFEDSVKEWVEDKVDSCLVSAEELHKKSEKDRKGVLI